MRNMFLSGAAALVLALGAISANAAPFNEPGVRHVVIHQHRAMPHRLASTLAAQEGRGAAIGEDFSARAMIGSHVHDPAFSIQQDEIYDGRF